MRLNIAETKVLTVLQRGPITSIPLEKYAHDLRRLRKAEYIMFTKSDGKGYDVSITPKGLARLQLPAKLLPARLLK